LLPFSFRVINTNNSKDITGIKQERDEWFVVSEELSTVALVFEENLDDSIKDPSLLDLQRSDGFSRLV
jgi:hypothetical protein